MGAQGQRFYDLPTRMIKLIVRGLALILLAGLASWFLVKPVRVMAPTLAGVTCADATVCTDDPARLPQARELYAEGRSFIATRLGAATKSPRLIFCATQACAQAFGLGARSAVTVAMAGTVIGPRAWKDYYVRHEMIHFLQADRLGAFTLLFKPAWFVEGMAYGLSDDPRQPLNQPFESYRAEFLKWYGKQAPGRVWERAKEI